MKEFVKMKNICLASSSIRRQQILEEMCLDFVVNHPVKFKEKLSGLDPEALVCLQRGPLSEPQTDRS